MKKINFITSILLVCAFALGTTGFSIAEKQQDTGEKGKLIGALVTFEHLDLFDFESYFNDNASAVLNGGEINTMDSRYQGRIYATKTEEILKADDGGDIIRVKFEFEGIDGIMLMSPTVGEGDDTRVSTSADEGMNDIHLSVHTNDAGTGSSIEGRIYYAIGKGDRKFYMNPVYQQEDGSVYVTSGSAIYCEGDPDLAGGESSLKLSEKESTTVNGVEQAGVENKVEVFFEGRFIPVGIKVLELDAESSIVAEQDYFPGKLPEEITPNAKTEYIIVETQNDDGSVSRELFDKEDTVLSGFMELDNGILQRQQCSLKW